MINKTEQEIMKNWKGDIDKPIVSVCCITYNHENYIAEALDSFLMQETGFPFEVIVRDDASPDKTADIIREYEFKYPNIIKPIYEKENGYQKGIKASPVAFAKAKGEYIALCEGDDYWTDAKKLQVQIDEMKKYSDICISFHPAYERIDGKIGKILSHYAKGTKIFTTSEVILGGGEFCPTASLIIKKEVLENLPDWYYTEAPVGDYFIQIFASLQGGALYVNKSMANYRISLKGSWTNRILENHKKSIKHFEKMINSLNKLNENTNQQYSQEINFVNSQFYCHTAKKYLQLGMYNNFEETIKNAYLISKDKNSKIQILYKLTSLSISKIIMKFLTMNRLSIIKKTLYTFKIIPYKIFFLLNKKNILIGKNYNFSNLLKIESDGSNFILNIGNNFSARNNLSLSLMNSSKIIMGNNVFFNNNCSINALESIEIGNNVLFGENVKIYDHNHKYSDTNKPIYEQGFSTSKVKIGSNVWIGSNVTILKGVTIGDNSIIGANTLIFKSIPNNSVVKLEQKLSIESKEL